MAYRRKRRGSVGRRKSRSKKKSYSKRKSRGAGSLRKRIGYRM